MTRNRQNLEIIRTITLLARIYANITAEGVETAEQLTQLQALGCNGVQGFAFAPPTATAAGMIAENREWYDQSPLGLLCCRVWGSGPVKPRPVAFHLVLGRGLMTVKDACADMRFIFAAPR